MKSKPAKAKSWRQWAVIRPGVGGGDPDVIKVTPDETYARWLARMPNHECILCDIRPVAGKKRRGKGRV